VTECADGDRRPLAGVRVVEVASWIAVPGAGALLADLGAEVLKVEPRNGDAMRNLVRKPAVEDPRRGLDVAFQVDNRGKRSIAIDLEHPEGPPIVHRLIRDADIMTTNLIPERQARYALDPKSVHRTAPRIVHVSLTGFGHEGPESNRAGFDLMAFFARSGSTELARAPGGPLPVWRTGQGDHVTALNLALATLAALRLRDQTGEGQVVTTSLLQSSTWWLASELAITLVERRPPPARAADSAHNPLFRPWRCRDDRWVLLMMLNAKPYWPGFCRAIERPEWIDDLRFSRHQARVEHQEVLFPLIEARLLAHTVEEWGPRFDAERLMWSPVNRLDEAIDDPQLRANGAFTSLEHPALGAFETVDTPFAIAGADVGARGLAPEVGQHTDTALRDAGFTAEEIDALVDQKVVGPGR
jgi:crotonobetainyl-CoA:carnitine CoA-transferase CaiB-like acyl-CoA transferase